MMDPQFTYDNLPWDTIASALQGTLSPDEDLLFRQWLAHSRDNQTKYDQLQQLWKDGLADYTVYREADVAKAWEVLQRTIDEGTVGHPPGRFKKPMPLIRRWMAAAAVFFLAFATGWWYYSARNAPTLYETALIQKEIALPDGSSVVLDPQTRILVAGDYNRANRTVILVAGKARFKVSHQAQLPFTVDLDSVSVKDIGTEFTVQRTKGTIKVAVSGGRVAVIHKGTGESHELSAGRSLIYSISNRRFGHIKLIDPASRGIGPLRFDNSTLSQIIANLQIVSGKKLGLEDAELGQKRLTVDLVGETVEDDLHIICASLNLEYIEINGIYVLKNINSASP